jgi:hypothetical protein
MSHVVYYIIEYDNSHDLEEGIAYGRVTHNENECMKSEKRDPNFDMKAGGSHIHKFFKSIYLHMQL